MKNTIDSGDSNPEVGSDLQKIEDELKSAKVEQEEMKNILDKELKIFLPKSEKLQDLIVLRDTIEKIRNLGDRADKQLEP